MSDNVLDPEPGDATSVLLSLVSLCETYAAHVAAREQLTGFDRGRVAAFRDVAAMIRGGAFSAERMAAGTDAASLLVEGP